MIIEKLILHTNFYEKLTNMPPVNAEHS